ncbi:hypothetical protein GGR52DRAFT_531884 [Hypoxylon sp. FL1284]|nr:hypothetical protein GGR52DRAFT_531884 [Hypoxylon sp. FL1284]
MSDHPNLSLPAKAPSMARYHNEPETLYPAALYTLVDLTDAELDTLRHKCEEGCVETGHEQGTSVRPAPEPRFVGQPLRAVFDYHLELGTQGSFEPRYFIAAVGKDWRARGVVIVALDDDDLECNVDSFRIKAEDTGLMVANLQIGNTSWDEEKEGNEFNSDDSEDDDDDDNDDDGDNGDGPPAPKKNNPLGYYVPIYIHSGLSKDTVTADLEPSIRYKSPEDFACRVQAKLKPSSSAPALDTASTQALVQQAAALHPLRCAKNPFLHKTHILVIDTADPAEYGMLMVKLPPWDSNASDLHDQGSKLAQTTLDHIRVPYSCHDGLQTRFLTLANGYAKWPTPEARKRSTFAAFQYGTHGKELCFGANLMDPGAAKRSPGEERLAYAPEAVKRPGHGIESVAWSYDEAAWRFPWFCRERRFVEGLDTGFFVCVDGDDVATTGVLLGRRKWDGRVWGRSWEEMLGLPVEGVKSVRVPAKEALGLLERGRKGETDGMSEELREFFS